MKATDGIELQIPFAVNTANLTVTYIAEDRVVIGEIQQSCNL
jgi:hypothetical protein